MLTICCLYNDFWYFAPKCQTYENDFSVHVCVVLSVMDLSYGILRTGFQVFFLIGFLQFDDDRNSSLFFGNQNYVYSAVAVFCFRPYFVGRNLSYRIVIKTAS